MRLVYPLLAIVFNAGFLLSLRDSPFTGVVIKELHKPGRPCPAKQTLVTSKLSFWVRLSSNESKEIGGLFSHGVIMGKLQCLVTSQLTMHLMQDTGRTMLITVACSCASAP